MEFKNPLERTPAEEAQAEKEAKEGEQRDLEKIVKNLSLDIAEEYKRLNAELEAGGYFNAFAEFNENLDKKKRRWEELREISLDADPELQAMLEKNIPKKETTKMRLSREFNESKDKS